MANGEQRIWKLVPHGSPPYAPDLHSQAKNKPFILLQSLEPPRGPDYFPMERFRASGIPLAVQGRPVHDVGTSDVLRGPYHTERTKYASQGGGGLNRYRGDGNQCHPREDDYPRGLGTTGTDSGRSSSKVSSSGIPAFTSQNNRSPNTLSSQESAAEERQGLTTLRSTLAKRSQVDQEITLFGGKIVATPGKSTGSRATPAPTCIDGAGGPGCALSIRHDGERRGADGSVTSGVGISRFQPLLLRTEATQWDEDAEVDELVGEDSTQENHSQSSREASKTARRSLRPFSQTSMPSQPMESPASISRHTGSFRQQLLTHSPAPTVLSPGGSGARGNTTPSLGFESTPATPGRKRPRTPTSNARLTPSSNTSQTPVARTPDSARCSSGNTQLDPAAGGLSTFPLPGTASRTLATPSAKQERSWDGICGSTDANPRSSGTSIRQQKTPTNQARNMRNAEPADRIPRSTPKSRSRSPRPGKSKTPLSPRARSDLSVPPPPRMLTLTDFAGADEVCFNPGASTQALAVFLERCEARGTVTLAMLWADLTTSFSAVTPRANQATAPIIGVIVYIPSHSEGNMSQGQSQVSQVGSPEDSDFEEGETYLLPLGACSGEDKEAKDAGDYQLPIECQATYSERWQALSKLLAMPVMKVVFNAQVALMPFCVWARHSDSTVTAISCSPSRSGDSVNSSNVSSPPMSGGGSGVGSVSAPMSATVSPAAVLPATVTVCSLFDPRVAAWMTNTDSTDKSLELEALCLGRRVPRIDQSDASQTQGERSTMVSVILNAENCSRRCIGLASKLSAELQEARMLAACHEVEMPAIPVLASMEVSGIVFLPERVTRFSQAIDRYLDGLRKAAAAAVDGFEFNLASPEQVAHILFNRLKLPSPGIKAGSAHASTSAEVLEKLQGKHPVVAPILEFRGVNKLKTTYVDKLAEKAVGAASTESAVSASQGMMSPISGAARIHAAWNQTAVRTGRLSCSRPNLQQIPKSSDPLSGVEGVNIRDAFTASKSFTLMAADYSQIEMRVLADASRDPGLAGLFTSLGKAGPGGGDVYRRLAAQVFGKDEVMVTDAERDRAKVVCLGIIYGMGIPQVARKLGVTEGQAQALVRSFLKTFPRIEPFLAFTRRYAREKGYVCTLTGRRRHLPEINNAHSATLKAQAERQAVNSVIQGTAADIIKSAMVLVAAALERWHSTLEPGQQCPRLIMQIHDELVFECPACEEDLGRLKGLLKQCMEVEAPRKLGIKCPLAVNMLVGMSWGSMRRIVISSHDGSGSRSEGGDSADEETHNTD